MIPVSFIHYMKYDAWPGVNLNPSAILRPRGTKGYSREMNYQENQLVPPGTRNESVRPRIGKQMLYLLRRA